jgi:hypothetical protein
VRALDELRFGPQRTLNLRDNLPSAADAVRRADAWLRQQQIQGSKEVLVITGRGNQSLGGVAVIRAAIEKLLFSLRRRGVVASHSEHNPGAFAVQLAPIRALVDAPARRRERQPRTVAVTRFDGLSADVVLMLRDLAERALDALGVVPSEQRIADEMQRQLRFIVPSLPGDERMETHLRAAIETAIAEYD